MSKRKYIKSLIFKFLLGSVPDYVIPIIVFTSYCNTNCTGYVLILCVPALNNARTTTKLHDIMMQDQGKANTKNKTIKRNR